MPSKSFIKKGYAASKGLTIAKLRAARDLAMNHESQCSICRKLYKQVAFGGWIVIDYLWYRLCKECYWVGIENFEWELGEEP